MALSQHILRVLRRLRLLPQPPPVDSSSPITTPSDPFSKVEIVPVPAADDATLTQLTSARRLILGSVVTRIGLKTTRRKSTSAIAPGPRVFAIVVAVDVYQDYTRLKGCVNDARAITAVLTEKFHIPASHIRCLVNGDATSSAIESTFKHHFLQNEDIRYGDVMIFFFAGYGSREPTSKRLGMGRDHLETLCPHDINFRSVRGISSLTLNGWMMELANKKGDNIIAILDTCHAGAITRKDERRRYLDPPISMMPRQGSRGEDTPKSDAPPGFRNDSISSHVVVAASHGGETAMEVFVEAKNAIRGAFSSTLEDHLRTTEFGIGTITYSQFVELLEFSEIQHPRVVGVNKDRFLFTGTSVGEVMNGFRVVRKGGEYTVYAGTMHGIGQSSRFTVRVGNYLHVLAVASLQSAVCVCKAAGKDFDTPEGTHAIVLEWGDDDVELKVYADKPIKNVDSFIKYVADREESDLVLVSSGRGRYQLERRDTLMRRYASTVSINMGTKISADALDAIALFNLHLYRPKVSNLGRRSPVVMQLYRLERNDNLGWGAFAPVDGEDLFQREEGSGSLDDVGSVPEAIISDMKPRYGIKLENRSDYDLFPYLFYFNPADYSIEAWYLPQSSGIPPPLPKNGMLPVGYGSPGSQGIRLPHPPAGGSQSQSGFVKLFVSTSYVDMNVVCQTSAFGTRCAPSRVVLEPEGLWDAWVSVITLGGEGVRG
ncbi:hypothetical protein JAAARDRAFT_60058 [Jaapia argillacea MUCL 33604]|uniref:Peptidase C14 caspase domain-containing protein n=1 Tax=Jaapia argillacea MUCL 33604 TaxID=933084 RepID=A0A067PJV6_9AGAM|nr:hypothetical protein JAAARDRAFT_60058 [Jaapia argillacea MUCL 33604]